MPDILRLRYVGAAPALVPALNKTVEPDCVYEVPGRIVTVDGEGKPIDHPADCFLAETGNPPTLRAWPTSLWADETQAKSSTAKTPKE